MFYGIKVLKLFVVTNNAAPNVADLRQNRTLLVKPGLKLVATQQGLLHRRMQLSGHRQPSGNQPLMLAGDLLNPQVGHRQVGLSSFLFRQGGHHYSVHLLGNGPVTVFDPGFHVLGESH